MVEIPFDKENSMLQEINELKESVSLKVLFSIKINPGICVSV